MTGSPLDRLRCRLENWADKMLHNGAVWLLDRFLLVIGFALLCIIAISLAWCIWFTYAAHRDCMEYGFTDVRYASLRHEGIWCGKYIGDIHITMQLENLENATKKPD